MNTFVTRIFVGNSTLRLSHLRDIYNQALEVYCLYRGPRNKAFGLEPIILSSLKWSGIQCQALNDGPCCYDWTQYICNRSSAACGLYSFNELAFGSFVVYYHRITNSTYYGFI